jgi:hypothetical protein
MSHTPDDRGVTQHPGDVEVPIRYGCATEPTKVRKLEHAHTLVIYDRDITLSIGASPKEDRAVALCRAPEHTRLSERPNVRRQIRPAAIGFASE